MKILSLFDGISCARVALERSGIPVEAYFSSEVDDNAIRMSLKNWPDIIELGDIRALKGARLDSLYLKGIDLLVGGSLCQDLSRANVSGKGLDGAKSSLFYEYVRVLKAVKPRYFILENVASMKSVYRDIITKELGVEPIMIDAALVSAQMRRRLFWTNIPGVVQPKDRGIMLKDVLEHGSVDRDKAYAITASYGKSAASDYFIRRRGQMVYVREATKKGHAIAYDGDSIDISHPTSKTRRGRVGKKAKNIMTSPNIAVFTRGIVRKLTPKECERCFSLPDDYTEGFTNARRYHALGNAFNVEVVRHIISHIPV